MFFEKVLFYLSFLYDIILIVNIHIFNLCWFKFFYLLRLDIFLLSWINSDWLIDWPTPQRIKTTLTTLTSSWKPHSLLHGDITFKALHTLNRTAPSSLFLQTSLGRFMVWLNFNHFLVHTPVATNSMHLQSTYTPNLQHL